MAGTRNDKFMDPGTAMALASVVSSAGQAASGGGEQQDPANTGLANTGQAELWRRYAQMLQMGGGDFGFGGGAKQANSQIGQGLANSGLSATGGGYGQALRAQAYGNAAGMAAQNRVGFGMQLLGTPLQLQSTTGANYNPASSFYGTNWADQLGPANSYRRKWTGQGPAQASAGDVGNTAAGWARNRWGGYVVGKKFNWGRFAAGVGRAGQRWAQQKMRQDFIEGERRQREEFRLEQENIHNPFIPDPRVPMPIRTAP